MKNFLKITIIIIVLLIILTAGYIIYLNSTNTTQNNRLIDSNEYENVPITEIYEVDNINIYNDVEIILHKYIEAISDNNREKLINMISNDYIKDNNIERNNVIEKIGKIQGIPTIYIEDIKQNDMNINITNFYVRYNLYDNSILYGEDAKIEAQENNVDLTTTQKENCELIVCIDFKNNSFCIIPNGNTMSKPKDLESIEKNESNEYNQQTLNKQEICEKLLENFKYRVIYKYNEVYDILDNNYKKIRFKNKEQYNLYENILKDDIINAQLYRYKVDTEKVGYTEYTCIDQYGNYYIFDEKGVMDYTVKLDTYTIENEDSINEYNQKPNEEKIKENLNKVAQAINRKDYEYLYSKLDEGLRTSSFSNYEEFKNYINNNFYGVNKFSYSDSDVQGTKGVFEMQIADGTGENDNIIEKNFIVTLGEGTNYTIAFNL